MDNYDQLNQSTYIPVGTAKFKLRPVQPRLFPLASIAFRIPLVRRKLGGDCWIAAVNAAARIFLVIFLDSVMVFPSFV